MDQNKAAQSQVLPSTGTDDTTTMVEASPLSNVQIKVGRTEVPVLRVALATVGVLFVLLLSFAIYRSLNLLLLFFIALLVATAIEPVVNWLRRGPFSRSTGILIVYSGLFLVLGLVTWIMLSVFLTQFSDFSGGLRRTVSEAQANVRTMDSGFVKQQSTVLLDVAESFVGKVQTDTTAETPGAAPPPQATVDAVTTTALTVAEIFFGLITIFVVAFYWLTERTLIKRSLMSWLPPNRANRVRRVWDDIEVKVGGWVRGQLTLMLVVGLASGVGYFLIGVKFWPALALFIAISEAIPLVGPYIGTAPAVLVALTQVGNDGLPALIGMGDMGSLTRALLVVGFALLLQTVEGNVLVPRIMKNSVGISPLLVIISILLGGTLAGLAGALVAVPLVGALQVVISDIKAAREGDQPLADETNAAQQTRADNGELVVAYAAPAGKTETVVPSERS